MGERAETVVVILLLLALFIPAVYVAGYILLVTAGVFMLAYSQPLKLLLYFSGWFAVLSAVMWVFEGDKVAYGWAATAAMLLGFLTAAARNLDSI